MLKKMMQDLEVCDMYVCLICMPYMYDLYDLRLPAFEMLKKMMQDLEVSFICIYALYVCLICMPYMYALHVCIWHFSMNMVVV